MMLRGTRGTVFVALFVLASLTGGTSSHSHGYIYLQARYFKIAHKGSAGAVAEPTACKEHRFDLIQMPPFVETLKGGELKAFERKTLVCVRIFQSWTLELAGCGRAQTHKPAIEAGAGIKTSVGGTPV